MKHLTLICLLTTFSCYSQPKNCNEFKIGTFKYESSDLKDWIIVRNDSIQIEFNKKDNIKIVGKVKWLNNCKYSLSYKEINDYKRKNKLGTKIEVEIVEKSKNMYKYEAYNGLNYTSDWVIKINDKIKL